MSEDGPAVERTVIVRDGRIAALLTPDAELPSGARRIDLRGKWLIPGLADGHVHFDWTEDDRAVETMFAREPNEALGLLFVAHGVTFVRSMWGTESILALRDAWNRGEGIGPRMITTGPLMTEASGSPVLENATDATVARAAVRRQAQLGFDAIKAHAGLSLASYRAICEEAQELDVPVDGHVPFGVSTLEVLMRSPQRTVEHLGRFVGMCVAEGAPGSGEPWPRMMEIYNHQSADKRAMLADVVRESGKWICPTIVVNRCDAMTLQQLEAALAAPELARYVSSQTRSNWRSTLVNSRSFLDRAKVDCTGQFAAPLEVLRAFVKAKVPIVAGTDTPVRPGVPGRVLHEELMFYVEVGMTPWEALATATRAAGDCFDPDHGLGQIRVGAVADLLCLDADPLAEIANTQRIRAVCLGGRWFDRAALDDMLTRAAAIVGG